MLAGMAANLDSHCSSSDMSARKREFCRLADASAPVLRNVNLEIPAGELCVVVGGTGTGKSTLLGAINGGIGGGIHDEIGPEVLEPVR